MIAALGAVVNPALVILGGSIGMRPEMMEPIRIALAAYFPFPAEPASLSRGPGIALAGEAALKLKETCQIHAEAYSAAEVLHGPIALSDQHFGVIGFVPQDAGDTSVRAALSRMHDDGWSRFRSETKPTPYPCRRRRIQLLIPSSR